jgi:hypothetical protein
MPFAIFPAFRFRPAILFHRNLFRPYPTLSDPTDYCPAPGLSQSAMRQLAAAKPLAQPWATINNQQSAINNS